MNEIHKVNKAQVLKALMTECVISVGYVDLNLWVQESSLQGWNIDDNGFSFIDYKLLKGLKEDITEGYGDCMTVSEKEEFNERIGFQFFYWVDASFLDKWRNTYDMEQFCVSSIDDVYEVQSTLLEAVKIEIDKIDK